MRTSKLLFLSASVLATALFAHCSSSTQGTCQETATCPPDASDGPPPLVCDTTKDPSTQAGCLDDRVGVFVDGAGGNDGNAGTKAAPVKTIAKALTLATTLTRVYVCEGTYAEDVTLDASHDGVSIYGGYACGAWTYSGNKPQIGASTLALKIDSTTKPITIEDVFVKAADATAPGGSSVAAFVNAASGAVSFVRVNLTAGTGKNAADGVTGTNYSASLLGNDPSIKGHDATGGGTGNGAAQVCSGLCTDGVTSTGGAGGQGGTSTQSGASGSPSLGQGAGGAANTTCGSGGAGQDGANQTAVGADAVSPTALGTLTAGGWAPTTGTAGTNGGPGQGGGGGGGATFANNTAGGGGGGGCGGCGGAGGAGGAGGGASIALASLSSTVSLVGSELHAGNAGNGGKGAAGQVGQSGGLYGNGSAPGCSGGNGGKGGTGGVGAGGVGGISVGILYKGTAPAADSATSTATTTGTFGTKGTGGNAGQNDGIDGVAQAVLQAP